MPRCCPRTDRGGPRTGSGRPRASRPSPRRRRPTGRSCGASFSSSGRSAASRAISSIASTNSSSVSFASVSVGSIISASGTIEREVDRRRVEAVVHEPLGDVERRDPVLALQRARREHELVHAEAVERQLVGVLAAARAGSSRSAPRPRTSRAGRGPYATDVRVRADEDAERAGEAAHLADRLRPVVVEPEPLAVADDRGHRQERLEPVADRDRPAARARRRRAAARTSCAG